MSKSNKKQIETGLNLPCHQTPGNKHPRSLGSDRPYFRSATLLGPPGLAVNPSERGSPWV